MNTEQKITDLESTALSLSLAVSNLESRIADLEQRKHVPTFQVERVGGNTLLVVCGGELTDGSIKRLATAVREKRQDATIVLEIESVDGDICARYHLDGSKAE